MPKSDTSKEIPRNHLNHKYLGIAPKPPQEYSQQTLSLPNCYEYEMFRIEDNLYTQDINIQKMNRILKYINEIKEIQDSKKKEEEINNLIQSNVIIILSVIYCF